MALTLPAPLRPWADTLQLFDDPEAWGPLVHRLSAAIGAAWPAHDPWGEPDGLGGLARRGPPDRLLASTWAIANAVPLEFLRRASTGELLYTKLMRKAPQAGRRVVVAFDTGPSQLGTPRLAQLALWAVLHERATRSDDELVPALLHEPDRALPMGLKAEAISAWQNARSASEAPSDAVARIRWRCGPWGPHDELWVVSARSWPDVTHQVRIEPVGTTLEVEVVQPRHRARVALPLPASSVCVGMLRRPLRPAAIPERPRSTASPSGSGIAHMHWSLSGSRLMTRGGSTWGAWSMPTTMVKGLRMSRARSLAAPVIAAGWYRGRCAVASYADGKWTFAGVRAHELLTASGDAPISDDGSLFGVREQRGKHSVWMEIGSMVYRWQEGGRVEHIGNGQLAAPSGLLFRLLPGAGARLTREDGRPVPNFLRGERSEVDGLQGLDLPMGAMWFESGGGGQVATWVDGHVGVGRQSVSVPDEDEVVGVFRDRQPSILGVVHRDPAGGLHKSSMRGHHTISPRCELAAMSVVHPYLAYIESDFLVFYDLLSDDELVRVPARVE